ncbi:MAG: hypothetical protein PWP31_887 [Clostridia bacterium]|nr:hypothetical protein [Clostridia bacterium]
MRFFKQIKCSYILLILSLLCVFCNPALAATGFTDVPDGHWAAKYISKMSAMGVIKGYADGSFQPNKPVNHVEAVIMAVRCKGGDSSSAREVPFYVPLWAKKEVANALDLGLIKDSEVFIPKETSTRAWVTRLLVRLIDKESEAISNEGLPTFTDNHLIPDWAKGYVKVAQDNNIIGGYADNSFQPNKQVTRAELAVMLGRVQDNFKDVLKGNLSTINGRIVNVGLKELEIKGEEGENLTFKVAYNVPAYDEEGPISLLDLKPDERVFLVTDGNEVKYIERLPEEPIASTIIGEIIQVYPEQKALVLEDTMGEYRTYYPTSDIILPVDLVDEGLEALRPGDNVEVFLNEAGNIVKLVLNGRSQKAVDEGVVYDLDVLEALITLQAENGKLASYKLSDEVNVLIEGQRFPAIKDIHPGDKVRVSVDNNCVTQIEMIEASYRLNLNGSVVAISPEKRVVTIDAEGELKAYHVNVDADIKISGLQIAVLDDVLIGDEVECQIENGVVVSLEVKGRQVANNLTGTVIGVDTTNDILTIKDGEGNFYAYKVKDNARIIVDGEDCSLSKVKKDRKVSLKLVDNEIIFLEASNSITGTVLDLDEEGLLLVLQDDNGYKNTYVIDRDVDVDSEDGRNDLDEVKRGDYVEITTDNDVISEIKLKTEQILWVKTIKEDWDKVYAEDEDGDEKSFYIRDKVELIIPGIDYPYIGNLEEGDKIKVTYMGFDLLKVEVLE